MPFDGLTLRTHDESLSALLAERNLHPVDPNTLEAHKQTQLKAFGPSFWYRHQIWLGIALMGSVGCMAFTAGVANSVSRPASPVSLYITMGWMCVWAALIFSGVFRASAGSRWEERWLRGEMLEDAGVPEPIAATARTLLADAPGSTLILGELVRESVVLDPYLLLVRNGEHVCIGVWDDTGIIASAA